MQNAFIKKDDQQNVFIKYVIIAVIFFFPGCKKFKQERLGNEAGIVLTFDDDRVDNWYKYLPLLDSAGVKATFYICKYNRFTAAQKNKLAAIRNHGHEIAFHTTNHYNMEEYVYKNKHTLEELMICEVEAGLKLMNKDGYYPKTFAYPYGAHNGLFDKALMRYFKSVRALNGTQDFSKSLVPNNKNNLLYALGIDNSSNRSDADITRILQSAKNNNSCAVLVAHDINTNSKYSVTLKRLKEILAFVNENGLKYFTASEISN